MKAVSSALLVSLMFWLVVPDALGVTHRTDRDVDVMFAAMDNTVWIADGPPSERHVYVIFNTDSPVSRAFFEQTRPLREQVQLRWVPIAGDDAAAVAELGTVDAVESAFAGRLPEPENPVWADRALNVNRWAMRSLKISRYSDPILVYAVHDGVRVDSLRRPGLQELSANVAARAGKAALESRAAQWLQTAFPTERSASRLPRALSTQDRPLKIYTVPDQGSRWAWQHSGDISLPVLAVVGDEWVRISGGEVSGESLIGFVHVPDEIRLSSMEFVVQPASGEVMATAGVLGIRQYPSRDAPVLFTLRQGYSMNRVGSVTLDGVEWAEVIATADGTRGYVLQDWSVGVGQ